MKKSPKSMKLQRKSIDIKIGNIVNYQHVITPKGGWLRTIRESIGMTTAQLASRMGVSQPNIMALQEREVTGKVTLELLEKAARAMGCEFRYAFVPVQSLEAIVDTQAKRAAKKMLDKTNHMMKLEQQGVEKEENEHHLQELISELKEKRISKIWEA